MFGSLPSTAAFLARLSRERRVPVRPANGTATQPWFRGHPRAAATVIAASSLAVLALQLLDKRASDTTALLYVMPIGLAAVSFGAVGGLAAAATAYLAFGVFALLSNGDHVGPEGWITRAAAMFLLGGLLGRASDQTDRATQLALASQRQRLIVEEQNRRYREGMELSDSILQHLAAAKWAIERGDDARATGLLARALASGEEMLGDLLPSRSAPPPPLAGPLEGGSTVPLTKPCEGGTAPRRLRRRPARRAGAPTPPDPR